jgi:hypothetical protein
MITAIHAGIDVRKLRASHPDFICNHGPLPPLLLIPRRLLQLRKLGLKPGLKLGVLFFLRVEN